MVISNQDETNRAEGVEAAAAAAAAAAVQDLHVEAAVQDPHVEAAAKAAVPRTIPPDITHQEDDDDDDDGGGRNWMKRIAILGGTVVEWYDFAIFGFFSDVFGEIFFPPGQDGYSGIAEAFVVFGVAFLIRPLGGLVLGHVGDFHGRKLALELSVLGMAGATFGMGCLPLYSQVGYWAIVGLSLTRLLQGLSVGGQLVASTVYYCEIHSPSTRGFYGSHVRMSCGFGAFSGGMVAALLRQVLSPRQLQLWGWRLPFWVGGCLVALSGLYLRRYHEEEEEEGEGGGGEEQEEENAAARRRRRQPELNAQERLPFLRAFEPQNLRPLLAATLVSALPSASGYLDFVWMAIFMNNMVDPPIPHAFVVNSVALLVCTLCSPLWGALSDKWGRVRTMTVGGILVGLLTWPVLSFIGSSHATPVRACLAQSVLGLSGSLWSAPMSAWLVERFPPEVRTTSVAVGYNVAQAILGGFSPAIATLLVDHVGRQAPALYMLAVAMMALLGLLVVAPAKMPEAGMVAQEEEWMDGFRSPLVSSLAEEEEAPEEFVDDDE